MKVNSHFLWDYSRFRWYMRELEEFPNQRCPSWLEISRCRAAEVLKKLMPRRGRFQNLVPRRCRNAMEKKLSRGRAATATVLIM